MVQWIERRPPESRQTNPKNKIKSRKTITNRAFTDLPFRTNLPEFAKIIEQGVKDKLFNTPYPYEAAKLFFELGSISGDTTSKFFSELDEKLENIDKLVKEFEAFEDAIERILGAKKGTINIVNRETLRNFQEKIKT